MKFDIGELIRVLVENCPNETVALFISTYGVFIVAIILIVVVLVRSIKKTGSFKDLSASELALMKNAINIITDNAAKTAVDNQKVTQEIKDEIRTNNDAVMQLLISFGIANGMSYTDITNTINKAKGIYDTSKDQYALLENEAKKKVDDEAKAEAEAKANEEALLAKKILEEKNLAKAKIKSLSSIKIGE